MNHALQTTLALEDLEFLFITMIDPERSESGAVRIVEPQARYANAGGLALNAYGKGPFCKFRIPPGLRSPGVYVITIDGEARYVGECTSFSARFNAGYGNISPRNCFKGGQETNCRVNNLICEAAEQGRAVGLWFYETTEFKAIEARLRAALRLPWNRV